MNYDAFSQVCSAANFEALGLAVVDFPIPGFNDVFKLDTSVQESQVNWVAGGGPLSVLAGAPSYTATYAQTDPTNKFAMPSPPAQSFTIIMVAASPIKAQTGAGENGTFLFGNFSAAGETAVVFLSHGGSVAGLRATANGVNIDTPIPLNTNPADLSFYAMSCGPTSLLLAEGYNGAFRTQTKAIVRNAGSLTPVAVGSSYSTTFGAGDRTSRIALAAQKNGTALNPAELLTAYKAVREAFGTLGINTL